MIQDKYHQQLIDEVKRRLVIEGGSRIHQCLNLLSEEEIWQRPNKHSNAVGNLVLHLCGNVTQWLLAGLGGQEDRRNRNQEFDPATRKSKAALLAVTNEVLAKAKELLDELTAERLVSTYTVQGFEETGIGILIHITEHFSYHVGQITYYVKAKKDLDVGYYKDLDLNITGSTID